MAYAYAKTEAFPTYAAARNPAHVEKILLSTVGDYIQDVLLNRQQRIHHKKQCTEILRRQDGTGDVNYAEQAILANLDWGMEALEEAITTKHEESRTARLEHAEKMLQVCALLGSKKTTIAGVPSTYLSAWSYLNLAYLWKLRSNNDRNAAQNILEMFSVDPRSARNHFAPILWEKLFQPHLTNFTSWYANQRHRIKLPLSTEVFSSIEYASSDTLLTEEQLERLQQLEKLYQDSLDDQTRGYARYYKDWLNATAAGLRRKRITPLMPIAEPPMTPVHDLTANTGAKRPLSRFFTENTLNNGVTAAMRSEQDGDNAGNSTPSSSSGLMQTPLRGSGEFSPVFLDGGSGSAARKSHKRSESLSKLFNSPDPRDSPGYHSFDSKDEDGSMEVDVDPLTSVANQNEGLSGMKLDMNDKSQKPPKDFVCPITGQLFNDPITLETGQTYERKAIQEWLDRGNTTCPITRQMLCNSTLPSTNYILKSLVRSWKELNPQLTQEFSTHEDIQPSTPPVMERNLSLEYDMETDSSDWSPTSTSFESALFRQDSMQRFTPITESILGNPASIYGFISKLKPALDTLCSLNSLSECESSLLVISQVWNESDGDSRLDMYLTEAEVVHGFVEVLCSTRLVDVQRAALYVLSQLVARDEFTRHAILTSDPGLKRIRSLLKAGLAEVTVLLHQLKLFLSDVTMLDLLMDLVAVIKQSTIHDVIADKFQMNVQSKCDAIIMLEHVISSDVLENSSTPLKSFDIVPALVQSLKARHHLERSSAASILIRCVRADTSLKLELSDAENFAAILELVQSGDRKTRNTAITLLSEIVSFTRNLRTKNLLKSIKAEHMCMHILLVHVQLEQPEYRTMAARLLLQLELLEEPRKGSIYREEAIETLIMALVHKERISVQVEAADGLVALVGHFASSGKPILEAWLLKAAQYTGLQDEDEFVENPDITQDEQDDLRDWERKLAKTFLGYEQASILETLGKQMRGKCAEVTKPCLTFATWLVWMMLQLPDTGVWPKARKFLLPQFISALEVSSNTQQRVIAALALYSFLRDSGSKKEILNSAKRLVEPLRRLKNKTATAREILKAFISSTSIDMDVWKLDQIDEMDNSSNGEVRALAYSKGRLYSGHSDGTIKVWNVRKNRAHQLREVQEHTKSITGLQVLSSKNRLYSSSWDKSIRVWSVGSDQIQCIHVFDLREHVVGLVVAGPMACIILQGTGLKVQYEDSATMLLNQNKHIQSVALSDDKIYCGCTDNSLQEMNSNGSAMISVQAGARRLIGKKPIYALQISKGQIFAAGAPVDGIAVKIINQSDKSLVAALPMNAEVRSMTLNDDFIYFGLGSGEIEVWLRERLVKVGTLTAGSKQNALLLDGDVLYSGSEDGKIRVWSFVEARTHREDEKRW